MIGVKSFVFGIVYEQIKAYMLNLIFLGLLTLSFLLSGINNDVNNITHVTIVASIAVGSLVLMKSNRKKIIPPHFTPLMLFTAILQIYWIFVSDKFNPFYYSLLFTEGLAVWYVIYNLDKKYLKNLALLFIIPAVIYSLFYLISLRFNTSLIKLAGLFFQPGQTVGHIQIGNLWAIIIAYLIGNQLSETKSRFDPFLLVIGFYFLVISGSRSAYIALFIALVGAFNSRPIIKKWIVYAAVIFCVLFIVYIGFNRSLVSSRPYYLQSLMSFINYPFGVGMGNFRLISDQYYRAGGILSGFSSATHNIFLEGLSGVGILSIPFIYWGYQIFKDQIKSLSKLNLGWRFAYLALSTVFLIDFTYTIPGMFILWFVLLGVSQREDTI